MNNSIDSLSMIQMEIHDKLITLIPYIWSYEIERIYALISKKGEEWYFKILWKDDNEMCCQIFRISEIENNSLFTPKNSD